MKPPGDAYIYRYWVLVNTEGYVWNGNQWTKDTDKAKHYLTWVGARVAQWQLRKNKVFDSHASLIEGKDPKYVQLTIYDALEEMGETVVIAPTSNETVTK